ncbi:homocysteine S-methyltransferase YbgG isoform X2 [Halyomorpha halys]|uniref:homocysteine S-methyltransferase YbgG isoform X2 n=1 Tax=Halyomorpha halys TaxID=286706 RepID=UPI0006D4C7B0|nr:uncharacterized protein LOC106691648 isoform X2 [Halyomorpha halys]
MNNIKLLDGGFSNQLAKYVNGDIDGHPLWTSKFVVTDKEKCINAHRDFIRGAEIIRTATYYASIEGYAKHLRLTKEQAIKAIKDAVVVAKTAIKMEEEKTGIHKEILVVGSAGPYAVKYHEGSEYTGSYADQVSEDQLLDWHRPKIEALISGGVDLLAFETIPCKKEAIALTKLLQEFPNTRAWISFSIKNAKEISSGENFVEAATECWKIASKQLVAIGVNCLAPELVVPLLAKLLRADPSIPLLVCPNSGETIDAVNYRWIKGSTRNVADYVEEWLNLGVSYIGGCCRTNAEDTQQMLQQINQWKNKIV